MASRGGGANRGRGRRGPDRPGATAWPWAKSRRGFRWALPEGEASVLRPKSATRPGGLGVAPRKRDGHASDPPPALRRPSFRAEDPKRKEGTRGQQRAAGTKKTTRRRQGYGGLAYLPAEASAKAGALFDMVNMESMRVGSRGRSERDIRADASRRDHPAFRPAV